VTDLVKSTSNELMLFIDKEKQVPGVLPTERVLSNRLEVSRSTLSKSFTLLEEKGILSKEEKSRLILRKPTNDDFFEVVLDEKSKTEFVEKFVLSELSRYSYRPGDYFSELELAKKSKTNTITVREALLKISKTGLIAKQPRQRWQVVPLTEKMVMDLIQFRSSLEISALSLVFNYGKKEEVISYFEPLLHSHRDFQGQAQNLSKLLDLENQLHKGLIKLAGNGYLSEAYYNIFSIIQYHLGQPGFERRVFQETITEHIAILEAILDWDLQKSTNALSSHLDKASAYVLAVHNKISSHDR